jgi:hypothetical protein
MTDIMERPLRFQARNEKGRRDEGGNGIAENGGTLFDKKEIPLEFRCLIHNNSKISLC